MQHTINKGDMLYNEKTGDYGIAMDAPIVFNSSRQENVCVRIPGRTHTTFWHVPDVTVKTSLKACVVGDMAEYITSTNRLTIAPILYISRASDWCILDIHGREEIAYGSIITRAMPAKMGA